MNLTLGERIKKRRNELNLTLKELSDKCGILPQLISDYENERKEPGVKNIKLLCKALGIYPNYLLSDDEYTFSKKNTYGEALMYYLDALDMSKKDNMNIDEVNKKVTIEINDDILVNALIQLKPFKGNKDMYNALKNFNINMLSDKEIEK